MYPEIQLFNYVFSTYKVAALFSAVTAFALSWLFIKKIGYSFRSFSQIFIGIIFAFPLGARFLNVLLNYEYYISNPFEITSLSFRGFSVLGGIFASILVCYIILKSINEDYILFLDALSIPFIVSFSIMKLGCFANACCYGKATSSNFGMIFPNNDTGIVNSLVSVFNSFSGVPKAVFPTQLFESLLALLFIPIYMFMKRYYKLDKVGETFLLASVYFTSVRFFVHPFRDFPYPEYIVNYLYPFMYFLIIVIGIMSLKKIQNNY